MRRRAHLAAISLAVTIALGTAACASSASETAGKGGAATFKCKPIPTSAGWSGIYRACLMRGTTLDLVNTSKWEVLRLQVPPDAPGQGMFELGPYGSDLAAKVERTEFPRSIDSSGTTVVVPPGASVVSGSVNAAPARLLVSIDYPATTANVTAMGLTGIVLDKVQPVQSEVQAIVGCADYVESQSAQISQWKPTSLAFWDTFANVSDCHSALRGASDALDDGESDAAGTAIDRLAGFTEDFFSNILPKIIGLGADYEL